MPLSAAFRLQQRLVRLAERAQAVEARNHQPLRFRASVAGIAMDDLADEFSVNRRCHGGQCRLEARVLKELPRRTHKYEATMIIRRRRISLENRHRARHRIEMVSPHQFVREGERVALELEAAGGVVWLRTHYHRLCMTLLGGWQARRTGVLIRGGQPEHVPDFCADCPPTIKTHPAPATKKRVGIQ